VRAVRLCIFRDPRIASAALAPSPTALAEVMRGLAELEGVSHVSPLAGSPPALTVFSDVDLDPGVLEATAVAGLVATGSHEWTATVDRTVQDPGSPNPRAVELPTTHRWE
jgi:hypothetical protein